MAGPPRGKTDSAASLRNQKRPLSTVGYRPCCGFLVLFVHLSMLVQKPGSCFTIPRTRSRDGKGLARCFQSKGKEKQSARKDPAPSNERPSSGQWKRSRRRVDYPSFAFETNRPSKSNKAIKFRIATAEEEDRRQVQETDDAEPQPSRTVSIPGGTLEKRGSLLNNIVDYVAEKISFADAFDFSSISDNAKRTRLLNDRAYAQKEAFDASNINEPPSLADLSPPPSKPADTLWISSPFRVATFLIATLSLPPITRYASMLITVQQDVLDEALSRFTPGISILYGTFVSLTLSILYRRQQEIQNNVAMESSLLTVMTRYLLNLFRKDKELAVEAGQCAADQIRTLVKGSRGGELMLVMYSDPYARMSELIEFYEDCLIDEGKLDLGGKGPMIGSCRDVLKEMNQLRASRLSEEALALPPTHFVILTVLTLLILAGYVVSILPIVNDRGDPPIESCLFFGVLCTVYVLFYNFTNDLNNPFSGVYQVRRSATASHLLEAKWLISNHPILRGEVDFEEVKEENDRGGIQVRSPGLGDMRFERQEIFPDSEKQTHVTDLV